MEELEAYNPLIPDGSNWKATFMIEYSDPAERAVEAAADPAEDSMSPGDLDDDDDDDEDDL